MATKCSVANCCLKSSFTFHSPRSRNHLDLWKKILNIKSDDFYVCDQHFEDRFLRIEKRLTIDAFPTQFIASIEVGSQDFCQCCLKSFVRSRFLSQNEIKYPIDENFKEEVLDVIGIHIQSGVSCSKCYEYIKQFKKFRTILREKQSKREEILRNQAKNMQKATTLASAQSQTLILDGEIKIKQEPMDEDEIESVIEVNNDSMFKIKEEVIEDKVVIKQESIDSSLSETFLISEIKTEPEEVQVPQVRKPSILVRKATQPQKIIIKKPSGGIIVKPISLKNLKILPQAATSKKFQLIKPPVMTPPSKSTGIINHTTNQLMQINNSKALAGYKCQYCPNRFIERRFVVEHIKQKHSFKCDLCPKLFPFKITLFKHQMSLHGGTSSTQRSPTYKYVCKVCVSRFPNQDSLDVHMAQKHANVVKKELEDKFGENIAVITNLSSLTPSPSMRINQTTIRAIPVNNLVNKILSPANLVPLEPEVIEEDPDGIPCLDCGLLLRPDKLLKHRMDAHSVNTHNIFYMCDICGIEIKGKTQLINHMTNKHLAKYFVRCEFCDGMFANQTEVICHKNLQHNFNGTRFTCHFCNRIFPNKRDMILHRKQHYSEKESRDKLARIFCKKFKSYEPKSAEY